MVESAVIDARRVSAGPTRSADARIAMELATLGSSWTVLRRAGDLKASVRTRLVIGAGGVFLITSTTNTGASVWVDDYAFIVDGTRTALVRDARVNARRIATLLGVRVTPIVVVDAPELTRGMSRSAVVVLRSSDVASWLMRRPRAVSTPSPHLIALLREFSTT
jgi:hypothetical protein